jgi:SprT protein
MAFVQHPLQALQNFLPEHCFEDIVYYLEKYSIQLSITKKRKTIHGNYTFDFSSKKNRITINGTLNTYAFLITLIHEIAHCICIHEHGPRVQSHGSEWKKIYSTLLHFFTKKNIFPADIQQELNAVIQKPGASSCAEPDLEKVLARYNPNQEPLIFLSDVPIGTIFLMENQKKYQCLEKRRTRYLCKDLGTNKLYLVSGLAQIKLVES